MVHMKRRVHKNKEKRVLDKELQGRRRERRLQVNIRRAEACEHRGAKELVIY